MQIGKNQNRIPIFESITLTINILDKSITRREALRTMGSAVAATAVAATAEPMVLSASLLVIDLSKMLIVSVMDSNIGILF